MLAALGDPATLVERQAPPASGPAPTLRALKSWEKDGLVLDLRNLLGPQGYASFQELQKTLDAEVAKARAVVLDLRMRGLQRYGASWVVPQLLPQLIDGELRVPGMREVVHTGLKPQDGGESPYRTEFTVSPDDIVTGTNGDITDAVLHGGIRFYFTGQEIRHGDDRQLQRKGIEPHVKMRPTVAGLQASRDELLERAIQLLREEPAGKASTRQGAP